MKARLNIQEIAMPTAAAPVAAAAAAEDVPLEVGSCLRTSRILQTLLI